MTDTDRLAEIRQQYASIIVGLRELLYPYPHWATILEPAAKAIEDLSSLLAEQEETITRREHVITGWEKQYNALAAENTQLKAQLAEGEREVKIQEAFKQQFQGLAEKLKETVEILAAQNAALRAMLTLVYEGLQGVHIVAPSEDPNRGIMEYRLVLSNAEYWAIRDACKEETREALQEEEEK